MLQKEKKDSIIDQFKVHDGDTGSPEVQIALLTERITQLSDHLKTHIHDHHSRRGLLMLIGQRRRQLKYLSLTHVDRYRVVLKRLNLRK
jgi:small subunit ribosomal protein S15